MVGKKPSIHVYHQLSCDPLHFPHIKPHCLVGVLRYLRYVCEDIYTLPAEVRDGRPVGCRGI